MNIKEAQAITHTLSKPGKMPGFAYSTPAHECKTEQSYELSLAASALTVTRTSEGDIDFKM
jgi:hypothetical protein